MTGVDIQRLRGEWIARGYSSETFARAINVSNSTLSRWLNGHANNITIGMANKIVEILQLDEKTANSIFFKNKFA